MFMYHDLACTVMVMDFVSFFLYLIKASDFNGFLEE